MLSSLSIIESLCMPTVGISNGGGGWRGRSSWNRHCDISSAGNGLVTWNLAPFDDLLVRTLQLLQLKVLSVFHISYNVIADIAIQIFMQDL
jgi:hypothetical protein